MEHLRLGCTLPVLQSQRDSLKVCVQAGTHDNETAVGWWKDSATEVDKEYLMEYLNTDGNDIAWDFIRSAYNTVARTSIMLIQVSVLSMAAKRIHAWEEPNQWQQQGYMLGMCQSTM